MQIVHDLKSLRFALEKRISIGLVPTMGNLHAGHLKLIAKAKKHAAFTIATIFVNRLQFLPHEDFDAYPRTLEDDCKALEAAGCDLVFAPTESDLYPEPQTYRVVPDPKLADILEGEFRPGFFGGVCTVVMKLFSCIQPSLAVFGEKDYQQLCIIQNMTRQFALPIDVLSCPTEREPDGLAMSSRNRYLNAKERQAAPLLNQTLKALAVRLKDCPLSGWNNLAQEACSHLAASGWNVDYLCIRTQRTLQIPNETDQDLVVLAAAKLGTTRLIDNELVRLA